MDDDLLLRVEEQRRALEASIAKLKKALRHWQTLEIEYEGLKDEFTMLPSGASAGEFLQAAQHFGPELVEETELRSLLAEGSRRRTPLQIADLLSKRVDYVSKNVSSIRKQLSDLEKQRNALLLAEDPDHLDEACLPLTEITEELDEDGHVVSSTVEPASATVPQLAEVLRRVGVDQMSTKTDTPVRISSKQTNPASYLPSRKDNMARAGAPVPEAPTEATSLNHTEPSISRHLDSRSLISDLPSSSSAMPPPLNQHGTQVSQVPQSLPPKNPNDTEEEAALRQEMIDYGLNEVNAIVAELDMAEDAPDISFEEDELDDLLVGSDVSEELDEEDEDDSEDERGMSTNSAVSNRYKRRMESLQKKLGLKSMQNLGPTPPLPIHLTDQVEAAPASELAGKAAIARAEAAKVQNITDPPKTAGDGDAKPKKKGKKVSFAKDVDIAPDADPYATSAASRYDSVLIRHPVKDAVVERDAKSSVPIPQPTGPKKQSRFKASRSQSQPGSYTNPEPLVVQPTQIMAASLIERPTATENESSSSVHLPQPPKNIDDDLEKRQISTDYYRMRNKMIQRQGGFINGGAEENYGEPTDPLPVVDPETGREKKVSRFKAARIRPSP